MAASLKESDCFGTILRSGAGTFTFVSAETGKPYATLDKEGLHVQKGSGQKKEINTVGLKALKTLIRALEQNEE